MEIVKGDLDDPRIVALLTLNSETNHAVTPPGSVHTLELDALRSPEIDFWALWDGDKLLAMGVLKRLGQGEGEVKSMHTAEAARRTGAGSRMLQHVISMDVE